MLAYSLLMGQLKQGRAKEWALHRLTTIGEACRAMIKEDPADDALLGDRTSSPDGSSPMNML